MVHDVMRVYPPDLTLSSLLSSHTPIPLTHATHELTSPLCSSQVLQVLEQLIRSGDLPLDGTVPRELPAQSHASAFLRELGGHLSRDPVYGEVIRCVG